MIIRYLILTGLIGSVTPAWSEPRRGAFCDQPNVCVSVKTCERTLKTKMQNDPDSAREFCRFEQSEPAWDIVRKRDILEALVRTGRYYIDEHVHPLSTTMLLLDTYATLSIEKVDHILSCVKRFHGLGLRVLDSHDTCEALTRYWNQQKEDELYDCVSKRVGLGYPPDESLDKCISSSAAI